MVVDTSVFDIPCWILDIHHVSIRGEPVTGIPLRRLVHGGHAARAEFFLDGVAVREGGSETVEIIAHGLVEYRILNIEQGILKW